MIEGRTASTTVGEAHRPASEDAAAEFWLDVGGTFTDCFLLRPDGSLRRHKLLSSGIIKGAAGADSSCHQIIDAARCIDPDQFWVGAMLRLLARDGSLVGETRVVVFDAEAGRLTVDPPLPCPAAGLAYELDARLEAPVLAIRWLLGIAPPVAVPPVRVRLGTTRGTNALLTRVGPATALVTTRGLGDVLTIGYQNRPRLFDLTIRKPPPLFTAVAEIDQRLTATGEVLRSLDESQARDELQRLRSAGVTSLAICFLHAVVNPTHEQRVARLARELGFEDVSLSSEVSTLAKMVSRGDTTVVDAYLTPVLRTYIARLAAQLPGSDLRLVTSSGGLVNVEHFTGKDSILSGPAGGAVGYARVAEAAGFSQAIGFDMGGTSTDVSRYAGRHEMQFETEKAGVRIATPMLAIETVAAGGGSICRFDGVKLVVGPESAGADPGPACYGRGGPLTITDMNFYLGRIPAARFPFPLDRRAVESRLQALADELSGRLGQSWTPVALAAGFIRIANVHMVKAIRSVSVARGADPREHVLAPFGGAAGQHACAVAEELGIRQILIHADAGLLSALGIGLADQTAHQAQGIYQPLNDALSARLETVFADLEQQAIQQLRQEAVSAERIERRRSLELRYQGVDASLLIDQPVGSETYAAAYEAEHRRRFGYVHAHRAIEVVAARVTARGRSIHTLPWARKSEINARRSCRPVGLTSLYLGDRIEDVGLYDFAALRSGDQIIGPAILAAATSTTVVDPGWTAELLTSDVLLVSRDAKHEVSADNSAGDQQRVRATAPADPILLEVFNHQFAGIAEAMGITLQSTASSVNVKERLDFSCALFTARGELVVNAPHVPVHLGAMGETVRRLIADTPDMAPGDVLVTNDPYRGGSHLPDVTVVTPVHDPASGELRFFTASRAHHAEIGGIVPGSMPPFSRNLAEEGVLIRNFRLVSGGVSRIDELAQLLRSAPHPSRSVAENLADIAAQVAANRQGGDQLLELIQRQGWPVVAAYMRHIQEAAEQKTRQALARLTSGRRKFVDYLDDGSRIAVTIDIQGDEATIDFTGTDPVLPGNLNANRAIVTAALMYTLRCLLAEDIPLNEGVLAPVTLILPTCLLAPPEADNPAHSAAIAAGNVETSQRVVDALLGALGLAAASHGTMNNLLFGDDTFGYYETICGGSGATANGPGADAVHTHMTNTRLTDPEVLERRYPVRLWEFAIHRGSGGAGRHRGGDGVIRRIEMLRPMQVSILSQRRGPFVPYGMAGGEPGACGRNLSIRQNDVTVLPALAGFRAAPGDMIVIETPGGGGWGISDQKPLTRATNFG